MSTFKYATASQLLGSAGLDLVTANIAALLLSGVYAPNPNTDQFVAVIPPAAIIARSGLLTATALKAGIFVGTIPEFDALLSPTTITALALYVETGNDALSQLIYYSSDGPGFPFVPNGFDYFVGYDQSNGGFFEV